MFVAISSPPSSTIEPTASCSFCHAAEQRPELVRETRLADSGGTEDRDEMRTALTGDAVPDSLEDTELVLATHEPQGWSQAWSLSHGSLYRHPGRHRRLLAFQSDGINRPVLDCAPRAPVRLLSDQDAVDRRHALEARGSVHDVSRHETLAARSIGPDRDDCLARVHRDPHLQIELGIGGVQLRHRVANRQCGADRSLGIVSVTHGRSEDGHDGVADELLYRAPAGLDLGPQSREVRALDRPDVLRIQSLGARGETDEVGEEHGHDLPLLVEALGPRRQSRRAGVAKARVGRVLVAAAWTRGHA